MIHPATSPKHPRLAAFFSSLKWKLILTSVLCTAAVSLFGNLFLYYRMNAMLTQKTERISEIHLSTMSDQLNEYLEDLSDLGNLCANDLQVVTALERRDNSVPAMKQALEAQNRLNAYLATSPLSDSIYQISAFNTDGRIISGTAQTMGTAQDYESIIAQPMFAALSSQRVPTDALMCIAPSIHTVSRQRPYVIALLCPVRGLGSTVGHGYLYIELGLDLFNSVLEPYDSWSSLYLTAGDTMLRSPIGEAADEIPTAEQLSETLDSSHTLKLAGNEYSVTAVALDDADLHLYSCAELGALDSDGAQTRMAVLTVLASSLLLTLVLSIVLATYLSKPISLLNARLHRIAENDFS